MNVMAAICNSFSGRRSFALLTRSPGLNERAPVEEVGVGWYLRGKLEQCCSVMGLSKTLH